MELLGLGWVAQALQLGRATKVRTQYMDWECPAPNSSNQEQTTTAVVIGQINRILGTLLKGLQVMVMILMQGMWICSSS